MAALKDLRMEQFARCMARGAMGADAVRAAGYATKQPHQQSGLLMLRQDVRDCIAELKAELGEQLIAEAEHEAPTREWATRKYLVAVRMAEEREDRANLIKALDSIAKLEGFMVDRVEQRTGPLDDFSVGQCRR